MRILAFDYGSKTVGVAVSDPIGITAQGVETIVREREDKLRRTLARIDLLVKEKQAERIVVGLPLNMNHTIGERGEKALIFMKKVSDRTGLPVIAWDERLTTVQAERVLMEAGVRRENRKQYLDEMAAVLILQSYLDAGCPAEGISWSQSPAMAEKMGV